MWAESLKSSEWFEDMKALKFILWPTLLFCLVWIGAIFFGPSLISSATTYLSKGRVNLTRVDVSPKLKISVALVDFALPLKGQGVGLDGVARAITIDWRFKNGFEIFGNIGPLSLKERGTISSGNFTLTPTSMSDWSDLTVQLDLDKLVGPNFELEQVEFAGKFYKSLQHLRDAELVISKIRGDLIGASFEAVSLRFMADHYQIARPLSQQNLQMAYSLQSLALPSNTFRSSLIEGDVKLLDGEVVFELSAADAELIEQGLTAKSISLTSRQSLLSDAAERAWNFSISDIVSKDPAVNIEKYSGVVTPTSSGISHRGRATISKVEMKTNQYFIGQIGNGILDVELISRKLPSKIDIKANGALTLDEVEDFSASISITSSLAGVGILDCINKKCVLGPLSAGYRVVASGSSLAGSLECEKADCLNHSKQHVLRTDNTNKFFQALSGIGLLNPLSLPVAYLAISSGEAVGDGHILKF